MASIRPIFEYDSLFDTDKSIIDILRSQFKNSKYFIPGILDEDPITISYLLRDREDPNPLSVVLEDKYKSSAYDLLNEIKDKYKDLLYLNIYYTDIHKLYSNMLLVDGNSFRVNVMVDNEYQEAIIRSTLDGAKTPLGIYNKRNVDLDSYDGIYLKYPENLYNYDPKPVGKHIFVLQYGFNVDYDMDKRIYAVKEKYHQDFDNNLFYVSNPYVDLAEIERD